MTLRRATRHISVKDVAAHAGVSFQTTSKVLNGGGTVSELTRARILQVASDLGYVPNLQARSLVMQRTRTVGFVASDFSDHNLSRFIVGAEHEARRQAYGVLLTSIDAEVSGTEYALPALMRTTAPSRTCSTKPCPSSACTTSRAAAWQPWALTTCVPASWPPIT